MTAYAVARIRDLRFGTEVAEYLRRIDATLVPYGGRFVIHGGRRQLLEGADDADLVMISFPDWARARAWYDSTAYRAILPLRTRHGDSTVMLIEGVAPEHHATDLLDEDRLATSPYGAAKGSTDASMAVKPGAGRA